MDNRIFLKVKVKSLAAEALIIRKEERKNKKIDPDYGYNVLRQELKTHRTCVVRSEAYHTLLAYGFIRGRTFRQVSPGGDSKHVNWDRVWKMIEKYGSQQVSDNKKKFEVWKSEDSQVVKAVGCNPTSAGSTPAPRSMFEKVRNAIGI